MALTPKELELLREYQLERGQVSARLAWLNEIIAVYSKQKPGPKELESPQIKLKIADDDEDPKDMSVRTSIRRLLRLEAKSKPAPEIAKALLAQGVFSDYKKGKDNVDTTLKRMRERGEVERTDDGWRIAG